jgi:D-glycero-D-manno-heptose 1,7-bisphosphate phosphatase
MIKLILLDRDGVINKELGGYVTNPDDFEVLPHVIPNLIKLKNAGIKVAVITNQGGIAKGLYTHQTLAKIHQKLNLILKAHQLVFDEIYYCPHHTDFGKCLCRKPGSIMIEKALARFGINLQEAIMIGDTQRDIEAANDAGVRAVKIESNQDWSSIIDEILAH